MTADSEGVTLSTNTLRWFNIVVAACALLGPPTAFFVSIAVFQAKQQQVDARQDDRLAEHRLLIDKNDTKFDKISDDIADMKEVLNQIVGKLNK